MIYKALLLFLATLLIFPENGYSAENLRFSDASSYKEKKALSFAQEQAENTSIPLTLARVDLNNDALDEYIAKPSNAQDCAQGALCDYRIIAFQDGVPIQIGQFDAHKILISDKKTYGIRDIIVYNKPHNDFKHETAVWNPFTYRFELL